MKTRFTVIYSNFYQAWIIKDTKSNSVLAGSDTIYKSGAEYECNQLNNGIGLKQYGIA